MQNYLNRDRFLERLEQTCHWDIIIIGGGATGLGTALDAAERGFSALLLEQADFAKGTSSRSTKLVHGGVRYLAQGNISLVYEALHERGLLFKNAPHLVKKQAFIIPCYSWFSRLKYLAGLKIYDWLAGKSSFGKSKFISRDDLLKTTPEIKSSGLKGGVEYWDGQFDDARLAIAIAQTAAEKGATLINYMKVTGLSKASNGKTNGVRVLDLETEREYEVKSKVVINATGVFVDDILQLDTPEQRPLVKPSQGIHLVLNKSFLFGKKAIMIPKTADGRVLFAVPWHNFVLLGTTDTPVESHSLDPAPTEKEINFILETAGHYLSPAPAKKDVLSVFAGLRPLAAPQKDAGNTKEISRSHKLVVSRSGLITITGGKWTTYRKMAEDTVNKAIETANLKYAPCNTRYLKLHGFSTSVQGDSHLNIYGTYKDHIKTLLTENPELNLRIHEKMPFLQAEVIWAVRHEMARTVEDVLARRLRVLFLDAKSAIEMAPAVASLIAKELNYQKAWEEDQIQKFVKLAKQYSINTFIPESDKVF
ncbi:glycerol-3-phosphate dehydrogenase/oxidase [Rubrolithibacter danxiaensis]|uniref:glycerol-3-phosphate dehydrogenase/oxidase n=1 Tax=Rubrolithibacter danxiaensis TaxID=3390805 RepID=UPI003BF8B3BF